MLQEPTILKALKNDCDRALARFPVHFDDRLHEGLERLFVNSAEGFAASRTLSHLRTILLSQYYLQKKMEATPITGNASHSPFSVKIFKNLSRICIALIFHDSFRFHRELLLKSIHRLLPGFHEIPKSFYLWHHPEKSYLFCYMEIDKLRGDELSKRELKSFEKTLFKQLITTSPLTPALFWPYNEEESCRQIELLQREVRNVNDPPHILVQFREQTLESLEFLIHLVRPQPIERLEKILKQLPESLYPHCHFNHMRSWPFLLECGTFSLKVPSNAYEDKGSINLLYARRYVLKHVEEIIGPMRDYNGGLFEMQQQHFESIRIYLGAKIPYFDLFAEKLFYAIHPLETRLSLELAEAEDLFTAVSDLMLDQKPFSVHEKFENIKIVKTIHLSELRKLNSIDADSHKIAAQAQFSLGEFHYHCLFCPKGKKLDSFLKESSLAHQTTKTLRLIFQEGEPLSLNPFHTFGDMRCRILSKLLFEGLMRINGDGVPEPAAASHFSVTPDGLLYTFKLRQNHWSNGEKVTAADYAMSLQNALSDQTSHPELLFALKNARLIKEKKIHPKELGIRAIDADTLQIELEEADSHFLHKLAKPFFFPIFGPIREPKWFNGPYLVRNQNKKQILLERNPYYWDSRRIFFDQIDLSWNHDADLIYSLFKEGKTDWIGDPLSILSPQIIQDLKNEGKLQTKETPRQFILLFNTKHPILSSPLIRRALSLCIDRKRICGEVFPFSLPLPPLLPQREEANRLFDLGLQQLGLSREEFPTLTFSYSHQTRRDKLAELLQSGWQEILNIPIRLEKMDWNIFRNKLERGRFEISGTIVERLEEDSVEFYERQEGLSSWNFSQWTHPGYREIVAGAKSDPKRSLAQAKKILSEELPYSPLFVYTHLWAHRKDLQNYSIDSEGCIDFSMSSIVG